MTRQHGALCGVSWYTQLATPPPAGPRARTRVGPAPPASTWSAAVPRCATTLGLVRSPRSRPLPACGAATSLAWRRGCGCGATAAGASPSRPLRWTRRWTRGRPRTCAARLGGPCRHARSVAGAGPVRARVKGCSKHRHTHNSTQASRPYNHSPAATHWRLSGSRDWNHSWNALEGDRFKSRVPELALGPSELLGVDTSPDEFRSRSKPLE